MYYCNICGQTVARLETSHSLDRTGQRTGVVFRTCPLCHTLYHRVRGDFSAWGKKGAKNRGLKRASKWIR